MNSNFNNNSLEAVIGATQARLEHLQSIVKDQSNEISALRHRLSEVEKKNETLTTLAADVPKNRDKIEQIGDDVVLLKSHAADFISIRNKLTGSILAQIVTVLTALVMISPYILDRFNNPSDVGNKKPTIIQGR